MDDDSQRELYFLIAKLMKTSFPEIGEAFIKECERRQLFPSCVFSKNPTFHELDSHSLSGIPNDQLMRLVSMALPKSQFPSLLITPQSVNRQVSITDILTKQLGPPLPLCFGMAPSHRIVGHFNKIYCLAIDLTCQILISGSDDYLIKIWKIPELTLIATVHAHRGVINDLDIHPSNLFFASSSQDRYIVLITFHDLQIKYYEVPSSVNSVRFSPNGKYLAAACEDGYVRLYQVDQNLGTLISNIRTIEIPDWKCANWVSFSPGSEFLAFVSGTNDVVLTSVNSNKYQILAGHTESIDAVKFSSQTVSKLWTHSPRDKTIKIWEETGGMYNMTWDVGPRNVQNTRQRPVKVDWNSDETKVVCITQTQIWVWSDPESQPQVETVTYGAEHCSVLALHPTLPNIAFVGCDNGHASIWDIFKMEAVVKMQADDNIFAITEACWSKDGQFVFAGDAMGGITVYGRSTKPFTTTQQVFMMDDNRNQIDYITTGQQILNTAKNPLDPQPPHYRMADFQLAVKPTDIDQRIVNEEKTMLERWQTLPNAKDFVPNGYVMTYNNVIAQQQPVAEEEDTDEEIQPDVPQRREVHLHEEEDGDFSIATVQDDEEEDVLPQNIPDDEDEGEESTLPRTRSSGPVDESIPTRSSTSRSRRSTANSYNIVDDNTIAYDNYEDVESEAEAVFSDSEEEKPKSRPPPKKKSRPSSSRSRSSNRFISHDDDDLINDDDEFDLHGAPDDDDDDELDEPLYNEDAPPPRATRRNTRIPESPPPPPPLPEVTTPMPPWMFNSKRFSYQFVPQFGEKVVYLRSGHVACSEQTATNKYPPPYRQNHSMSEITEAIVTSIEADPNYLFIYLKFINTRRSQEGIVAFPINDSLPFLIPADFYEVAMNMAENLAVGQHVSAFFSEEGKPVFYDAIVTSIKPDLKRHPYESIGIQLVQSNDTYFVCPWELAIDDPAPSPVAEMAKNMLISVRGLAQREPKYTPFLSLRTDEMKDKIWKSLSFPMDLDLFMSRLEDGWYQTLNEMIVEVGLFSANAPLLGLVQEDADALTEDLKNMIYQKAKFNGIEEIVVK